MANSVLAILSVFLLGLAPALAAAQEPLKAFDQLRTRLRVGDTIVVVDASSREHTGRLVTLTPSSLVLSTRPGQPFVADQVRAVMTPGPHPYRKGLLWGMALGTIAGGVAWAVSAKDGSAGVPPPCQSVSAPPSSWTPPPCGGSAGRGDGTSYWVAVPIGAGAGALTGIAISALIRGDRRVVYRAPAAAAIEGVTLSIAPIVSRRPRGVAVSFAF